MCHKQTTLLAWLNSGLPWHLNAAYSFIAVCLRTTDLNISWFMNLCFCLPLMWCPNAQSQICLIIALTVTWQNSFATLLVNFLTVPVVGRLLPLSGLLLVVSWNPFLSTQAWGALSGDSTQWFKKKPGFHNKFRFILSCTAWTEAIVGLSVQTTVSRNCSWMWELNWPRSSECSFSKSDRNSSNSPVVNITTFESQILVN